MKDRDGKPLKINDKVWITYTPTPGHGSKIDGPGVVRGVGTEENTNLQGTKYFWVTVSYSGIHRSVFPSWCLKVLK